MRQKLAITLSALENRDLDAQAFYAISKQIEDLPDGSPDAAELLKGIVSGLPESVKHAAASRLMLTVRCLECHGRSLANLMPHVARCLASYCTVQLHVVNAEESGAVGFAIMECLLPVMVDTALSGMRTVLPHARSSLASGAAGSPNASPSTGQELMDHILRPLLKLACKASKKAAATLACATLDRMLAACCAYVHVKEVVEAARLLLNSLLQMVSSGQLDRHVAGVFQVAGRAVEITGISTDRATLQRAVGLCLKGSAAEEWQMRAAAVAALGIVAAAMQVQDPLLAMQPEAYVERGNCLVMTPAVKAMQELKGEVMVALGKARHDRVVAVRRAATTASHAVNALPYPDGYHDTSTSRQDQWVPLSAGAARRAVIHKPTAAVASVPPHPARVPRGEPAQRAPSKRVGMGIIRPGASPSPSPPRRHASRSPAREREAREEAASRQPWNAHHVHHDPLRSQQEWTYQLQEQIQLGSREPSPARMSPPRPQPRRVPRRRTSADQALQVAPQWAAPLPRARCSGGGGVAAVFAAARPRHPFLMEDRSRVSLGWGQKLNWEADPTFVRPRKTEEDMDFGIQVFAKPPPPKAAWARHHKGENAGPQHPCQQGHEASNKAARERGEGADHNSRQVDLDAMPFHDVSFDGKDAATTTNAIDTGSRPGAGGAEATGWSRQAGLLASPRSVPDIHIHIHQPSPTPSPRSISASPPPRSPVSPEDAYYKHHHEYSQYQYPACSGNTNPVTSESEDGDTYDSPCAASGAPAKHPSNPAVRTTTTGASQQQQQQPDTRVIDFRPLVSIAVSQPPIYEVQAHSPSPSHNYAQSPQHAHTYDAPTRQPPSPSSSPPPRRSPRSSGPNGRRTWKLPPPGASFMGGFRVDVSPDVITIRPSHSPPQSPSPSPRRGMRVSVSPEGVDVVPQYLGYSDSEEDGQAVGRGQADGQVGGGREATTSLPTKLAAAEAAAEAARRHRQHVEEGEEFVGGAGRAALAAAAGEDADTAAARQALEQELAQGTELLGRLGGVGPPPNNTSFLTGTFPGFPEQSTQHRQQQQPGPLQAAAAASVPMPSPMAPGSLEALRTSAGVLVASNAEALQELESMMERLARMRHHLVASKAASPAVRSAASAAMTAARTLQDRLLTPTSVAQPTPFRDDSEGLMGPTLRTERAVSAMAATHAAANAAAAGASVGSTAALVEAANSRRASLRAAMSSVDQTLRGSAMGSRPGVGAGRSSGSGVGGGGAAWSSGLLSTSRSVGSAAPYATTQLPSSSTHNLHSRQHAATSAASRPLNSFLQTSSPQRATLYTTSPPRLRLPHSPARSDDSGSGLHASVNDHPIISMRGRYDSPDRADDRGGRSRSASPSRGVRVTLALLSSPSKPGPHHSPPHRPLSPPRIPTSTSPRSHNTTRVEPLAATTLLSSPHRHRRRRYDSPDRASPSPRARSRGRGGGRRYSPPSSPDPDRYSGGRGGRGSPRHASGEVPTRALGSPRGTLTQHHAPPAGPSAGLQSALRQLASPVRSDPPSPQGRATAAGVGADHTNHSTGGHWGGMYARHPSPPGTLHTTRSFTPNRPRQQDSHARAPASPIMAAASPTVRRLATLALDKAMDEAYTPLSPGADDEAWMQRVRSTYGLQSGVVGASSAASSFKATSVKPLDMSRVLGGR